MSKINVAVLFGGKSAEHEVSLNSAANVVKALNRDRFQPSLIAIDKQGFWHSVESPEVLEKAAKDRKLPFQNLSSHQSSTVTLVSTDKGVHILDISKHELLNKVDVVFPVLHGPFGEDGSLQGYLKTLNVAYVGSGVLGSAVGMDKDVMKRLLRDAGLPIGPFLVIHAHNRHQTSFAQIEKQLGVPFFVKSANMGSSIGVHKVRTANELELALNDAFLYDHKVVVEGFIQGREVECSVLGNHDVKASTCGEIKPNHDFYSYEAKYLDDNGANLMIPANLPPAVMQKARDLAVQTFKVLCCEGFARVDFFVKDNNEVLINEINTLPGFTKISMYPKMWEASGIGYSQLVSQLIDLALEKFSLDSRLKTTRE